MICALLPLTLQLKRHSSTLCLAFLRSSHTTLRIATHRHQDVPARVGSASPLSHRLPTDEASPLPLAPVRALYVALQIPRVIKLAAADVTRERT